MSVPNEFTAIPQSNLLHSFSYKLLLVPLKLCDLDGPWRKNSNLISDILSVSVLSSTLLILSLFSYCLELKCLRGCYTVIQKCVLSFSMLLYSF